MKKLIFGLIAMLVLASFVIGSRVFDAPAVVLQTCYKEEVLMDEVGQAAENALNAGCPTPQIERLPQQNGRYWVVYSIRVISTDPPPPLK